MIELLVAMSIFTVCIISVSGIFISFVNAQRKVTAIQSAQEVGRYLMDYMTKEIRMGVILSTNSFSSSGSSGLYIRTAEGENVAYFFGSGILTRNGAVLTPSDIDISGKFYIGSGRNLSGGKVTATMKISRKGSSEAAKEKFNLQSTIAARSE